jgi:hypothetical protein
MCKLTRCSVATTSAACTRCKTVPGSRRNWCNTVACSHPAEALAINVIVTEELGVLFEAQPAQPRRYVHAVILARRSDNLLWTMIFLWLSIYQRKN